MPLTIWNFVWSINLTMGGNWAVTQPPIIATGYVSFSTALNTRYRSFEKKWRAKNRFN